MKHTRLTVTFIDGEEKTWHDVIAFENSEYGMQFIDSDKKYTVYSTHIKYVEFEIWSEATPSTTSTPEQ